VIAKVTRDRYMRRVHALYPEWGFAEHVGYSTPEHREAIVERGICPLHRRSFASIAYTQLALGEEEDLESVAEVIDIREAIRAEADPDDIEAIAGDG
jgi:ribonuclease HII